MGKSTLIPKANYRKYRVYPWDEKEVGEFFDVPLEKRPSVVTQFPRMKPKEWTSRKMQNEQGQWVARIWRLK